MSSVRFARALALALVSSAVVVAGCSSTSSKPKSQVVVSPMPSGVYGDSTYTGGALVDNSPAITAAAASMQAVVHFDFDSDAIRSDAAAVLDQHIGFLSANPSAQVLIAGHTDERGSREYNMSLGERRAVAVASYLASKGVTATNIQVVSYGEEQPVAVGSNEEAWAQNRRAELSY